MSPYSNLFCIPKSVFCVPNTRVTIYHLISQAGWNRCTLSIYLSIPPQPGLVRIGSEVVHAAHFSCLVFVVNSFRGRLVPLCCFPGQPRACMPEDVLTIVVSCPIDCSLTLATSTSGIAEGHSEAVLYRVERCADQLHMLLSSQAGTFVLCSAW